MATAGTSWRAGRLLRRGAERLGERAFEQREIRRQEDMPDAALGGSPLNLTRRVAVAERDDANALAFSVSEEGRRETVAVLHIHENEPWLVVRERRLRRFVPVVEDRALPLQLDQEPDQPADHRIGRDDEDWRLG
jgi:hypothetical protein